MSENKIKVHYNPGTNLVIGYYPNWVKYKAVPEPFIEIEKEDQEFGKTMVVVKGVYQEYTKTDAELLQDAKLAKKAEVNLQRDKNISASHLFRKDNIDHHLERSVLNRIAWLENGNRSSSTDWVTDENRIISISRTEFKNISTHLGIRDTQEVTLGRRRKNAIDALTDIKAVKEYDITTTDFD